MAAVVAVVRCAPAQETPAKQETRPKSVKSAPDSEAPAMTGKAAKRSLIRAATQPDADQEPKKSADKAERKDDVMLPRSGPSIDHLIEPPRNPEDYWIRIDRALRYGQLDEAKRHLSELMDRDDLTDEKILELREKHGSSMLLRLELAPELEPLARKLIDRANAASRARARDAARIRHFLGNLGKSAGERDYAILQLRHSGAHAIPYFVEALRQSGGDKMPLLQGLFAMPQSSWPAVAAVLDSDDEPLMSTMIELLRQFGVPESADALWYVAEAQKYSRSLRSQARDVLAALTGIPLGNLPAAAGQLAALADRDYRQLAELAGVDQPTEVWRWENDRLVSAERPVLEHLEARAMKCARRAIELDPSSEHAKLVLISLALHSRFEKAGIDQSLASDGSGVFELSLSAGPDLVARVLERGMRERRHAVVLGAVQVLGRIGNVNLLADRTDQSAPLTAALNYPNSRVQFAAALAALEINPPTRFQGGSRVVDTLVRALDPEGRPLAVVIDGNDNRGNRTAQLLTQFGYQTRVCRTGKSGFEAAAGSSAVDLVFIDAGVLDWPIVETIANFRADARTKGIPITILRYDETPTAVLNLAERYANLMVIPRGDSKEQVGKLLALNFAESTSRPLTPAEKASQQSIALDWVLRLARGEIGHLDVRSASDRLASLLRSAELGSQAAEALGYLPSAENQARLAFAVLDDSVSMPVRLAACNALTRNTQRGGKALDRSTTARLVNLFEGTNDRELRTALARLVGSFGPDGAAVAQRILRYRPLVASPAPTEADGGAKPVLEPKPKEPPEPGEPAKPPAKPPTPKKPAAKNFFGES
jgi:CheY-like chemotaxis protein